MNDNEKEAARKILAVLREHKVTIEGCGCCGGGLRDLYVEPDHFDGAHTERVESSTFYYEVGAQAEGMTQCRAEGCMGGKVWGPETPRWRGFDRDKIDCPACHGVGAVPITKDASNA